MVSVPGQADPPPQTVSVTVDPAPMAVSVDVDTTDLATLLTLVGWPADQIDTACAVALAEAGNGDKSGVYADAVGDLNIVDPVWGASIGPFQIRAIRAPLSQYQSFDRWRCAPALLNPFYNCWVALQVYKALGWGAWSTYTQGTYQQYVGKRPKIVTGHSAASSWWK